MWADQGQKFGAARGLAPVMWHLENLSVQVHAGLSQPQLCGSLNIASKQDVHLSVREFENEGIVVNVTISQVC